MLATFGSASLRAQTFSAGHLDISVRWSLAAGWGCEVFDAEAFEFHPLSGVLILAGTGSQKIVPNHSDFTAFMGAASGPVWILPQVEDSFLPFLGLSGERIPAGTFVGNQIRLTLLSLAGPGDFALYTIGPFGTPSVRINTRNGIDASDFVNVPTAGGGGHIHINWSFTAPGDYAATFQASGTRTGGGGFTNSPPFTVAFRLEALPALPPMIHSITSPTNGVCAVTFSCSPHRIQRLETSFNLTNWTELTNFPSTNALMPLTFSVGETNAQFFRIRTAEGTN
jgi:surface-anchored protein